LSVQNEYHSFVSGDSHAAIKGEQCNISAIGRIGRDIRWLAGWGMLINYIRILEKDGTDGRADRHHTAALRFSFWTRPAYNKDTAI